MKKPTLRFPPAGKNDLLKGDPISGWNRRAQEGYRDYIEEARRKGIALDADDFRGVGPHVALRALLRRDITLASLGSKKRPPGQH